MATIWNVSIRSICEALMEMDLNDASSSSAVWKCLWNLLIFPNLDTQKEKNEWMEGIYAVIDEVRACSATFGSSSIVSSRSNFA